MASLVRSALAGGAGGTMSLPSLDQSRLLTIVVVGLRSHEVSVLREVQMHDAKCAIFVIDPSRRRAVGAQRLMNAYGLTKAEARVAASVSSGRTASKSALALGLSSNTVKTHLRRVFAKTETRGQGELAALLTALGIVKAQDVPEDDRPHQRH
jgi:DNA-binding CsgD family transcriptional regulator